jgi:gliding motility-associated-like protein
LVEAYPLPTASLSLRASCEGDTTLFLASSQVVNGTVSNSWTIGSQVYNSDSVVYQMPNDTQVIVQLNTMSNYGCMDQVTDTIEVYDKPVIDLSLLDKCADDSIDFLVTELPGTRDIITSYNWTLGDGTTSMANGFKHFYADTGTYTVKVVVENANGCRDTTQETVSVFDIPTSLFSTTNACLGDSIAVTSEASIDKGSIVSTLWDLGSGYQLGDSTFKIAATAVGTNSISQKVISDNGCEAEYQAPYTVYFVATPDITTTGNCENQIFTLNAIPSQADSVSDYKWRILSDSFNTSTTNYSFPSEGTYTLNLELTTNRGCISDSNFSVEVDSIPDVVIQTDVFCNDNLVRFETPNTGTLAWDIGDGTTSSLDSFEHMYASLSSYPIELIVTNSYGCNDTGNTDVDIANIVNPSFRLSNVCVDESMWVVNTTTGLGAAISGLNFDMGNGIEIAALDSFQYSYPTAGTYTVTMTLTTLSGCSYTTQQNVTIYPLPQAGFTLFPESADVFTADTVIYYLSDGTEYTAFDFNHKFADSGRYTINQFVESINGCMDSTSRSLYIQFAYKLFIPNTFTPNNDGKNEEFKPVGLGMKSFEMQIFNRWGEKVFESQQANQAWDGKDAIQGYYTYIIRARDYQGRIYNYKGHVYLLH